MKFRFKVNGIDVEREFEVGDIVKRFPTSVVSTSLFVVTKIEKNTNTLYCRLIWHGKIYPYVFTFHVSEVIRVSREIANSITENFLRNETCKR